MAQGIATGHPGITVDTNGLRDASAVLVSLSQAFDVDDHLLAIALEGIGAPQWGARASGYGRIQLEEALRAFSHQWRVRRQSVSERIGGLAGSLTLIADHVEGAEASLANAMAVPAAPDPGWR